MLSSRPKKVRTETLVASCMLRKVGSAYWRLLLLLLLLLVLKALPRLHVLVKVRAYTRDRQASRSAAVPEIGVDVAGILRINNAAVGHHRELLRSSHDSTVEACCRWVRIRSIRTTRHGGNRKMVELRTTSRDGRLECPSVAAVRSAREMRHFGSRSERVGRGAHSAAVARGAVEAVRAARNAPGHGAGSAVHVEATVTCCRRWTGRHGRSAVRSAGVFNRLMHLEATVSRRSRHRVFFDLEA